MENTQSFINLFNDDELFYDNQQFDVPISNELLDVNIPSELISSSEEELLMQSNNNYDINSCPVIYNTKNGKLEQNKLLKLDNWPVEPLQFSTPSSNTSKIVFKPNEQNYHTVNYNKKPKPIQPFPFTQPGTMNPIANTQTRAEDILINIECPKIKTRKQPLKQSKTEKSIKTLNTTNDQQTLKTLCNLFQDTVLFKKSASKLLIKYAKMNIIQVVLKNNNLCLKWLPLQLSRCWEETNMLICSFERKLKDELGFIVQKRSHRNQTVKIWILDVFKYQKLLTHKHVAKLMNKKRKRNSSSSKSKSVKEPSKQKTQQKAQQQPEQQPEQQQPQTAFPYHIMSSDVKQFLISYHKTCLQQLTASLSSPTKKRRIK